MEYRVHFLGNFITSIHHDSKVLDPNLVVEDISDVLQIYLKQFTDVDIMDGPRWDKFYKEHKAGLSQLFVCEVVPGDEISTITIPKVSVSIRIETTVDIVNYSSDIENMEDYKHVAELLMDKLTIAIKTPYEEREPLKVIDKFAEGLVDVVVEN